MIEWQDEGLVIAVRPHGETSAILEVFTLGHGRHGGVVRGGASRRMAAHLQPGSQVAIGWRARLDEHLGSFTVEPLRARAGLMCDRAGLAALNAVTALLHLSLPEREAHPRLWQATVAFLDGVEAGAESWPAAYLHWELALLEELGFGLDLATCAVTGVREGLAFVSPRSGRAVSLSGAGDWADRLLPLPHVLLAAPGAAAAPAPDLAAGLRLTGFFLERGLEPLLAGRPLPEARARLAAVLGG
jgi:DNA repair protein RecO (recombination protein O)